MKLCGWDLVCLFVCMHGEMTVRCGWKESWEEVDEVTLWINDVVLD